MTVEEAARRAFRDIPAARVATLDPRGAPHLAALWFVWREDALYFSVRQGGATWRNAEADPRVAVVIDRGRDWSELSGVRLEGFAHVFAAEHPDVRAVMSGWHEKYRSMLIRCASRPVARLFVRGAGPRLCERIHERIESRL